MDPSLFPFFSSRPEADDLDMACPFDQADSTAATIAGLDLSDTVPAPPLAGTLSSYVTPTASMSAPADGPFSVANGRPVRTPSHRRDEGRAKKRARIDQSPELEFESIDYWMKFEEEEMMEDGMRQPNETGPSRRPSEISAPSRQWTFDATPAPLTTIESRTFANPSEPMAQPQFGDFDFFNEGMWDSTLAEQNDNFGDINLAEEMAKLDSAPPQTVPPPREGLYSTPLSWEQPQPGVKLGHQLPPVPTVLSDAEKRRLLDIAMNTGRSSFVSSFDLGFNDAADPWADPTPSEDNIRPSRLVDSPQIPLHNTVSGSSGRPSLSRQTTANTVDASMPANVSTGPKSGKAKEKPKSSGDRTGHNDIERKYRTNLKDKISELRDAVPALRSMAEDGGEDDPHRGSKVSKGTVMTKAAEYIRYLERRHTAAKRERQELEKRLHAFEELMAAAAKQTFLMRSQGMFDPRNFPS